MEHPSPLVAIINALIASLGIHAEIPDHMVYVGLITLFILFIGLAIRSRLSVDRPGTLQIVLEDLVSFLVGVLEDNMGPKGRQFLPLLGTLFVFILIGNLMGQIPGLGSPTSNINVPFACAISLWLYYHYQGVRAHGILSYIKHFAVMPGVPIALAPMIFIIEIISHVSRVLSLTLRLFGNIFGEHLVVLILASIVPFVVPVPIQFLGLIVGPLQAFIFLTLGAIYLTAATHVDDHGHEHAH
ncbi:MAG: ATP synthase F0 subunit A [Acidobacteria bacterium RIFCSPLOWO2_12_FULL_67_14b]|nr:MAG: ATP synthase F0 subunit A [Acidobacteria bacterium RIFCSPLOWO2_12_FULL_67_14b]